jgi:CubicO group peptidase (beta-lactamase class C family)
MALRFCFLLAFFSVSLPGGLHMNSTSRADDPFDDVRSMIREAIKNENVPSLTVAVIQDGKITWQEGFGLADREKKLEAHPDTMYSLASISKPITATGFMLLVSQQKLQLDDKVNDHLGDAGLTAPVGGADRATLRQVANHTSGLPLHYQFFYENQSHKVPDREETIRRYGVLVTPPGEVYQYANLGYGILDHIIHRKSGQPYGEFMHQHVFLPLGMKNTSVHVPDGDADHQVAVRYDPSGKPIPYYLFDHDGASAVYSSAHDLARFALFHIKAPLDDQQSLFDDALVDAMQDPTAAIDGDSGYGVGWRIDEDQHGYRVVSHTGGMPGVRTKLAIIPSEKIAVVALTNTRSDLPFRVVSESFAALLPDYARAKRRAERKDPVEQPPVPFTPGAELTGFWQGEVSTHEGLRKISLWIQADGDVHAQLGSRLKALVNDVSLEDGFLRGRFQGNLDTADTDRAPYHVHLRLRLEEKNLAGNLSAISISRSVPEEDHLPEHSHYAVSHWVSLQRSSPLPGSISLFDGRQLGSWKVAEKFDFKNHGEIKVQEGVISLGEGSPATGIYFNGDLPRTNYEISLDARRTGGSDFFCGLTFPLGTTYCSFIVGGWGGGVVGMSNINDMSAVENETTGYLEVKQGRWYHIRVRVTGSRLQAWIDGERMVDMKTGDNKFSIWWEQEPMRPLGIASWNTSAELRNIRITYALDR